MSFAPLWFNKLSEVLKANGVLECWSFGVLERLKGRETAGNRILYSTPLLHYSITP
jgi:hypothetical protein